MLGRALAAAQAGGDERQLDDAQLDLLIAAILLDRPAAERDAFRLGVTATVERMRWRRDPDAMRAELTQQLAFGHDDVARGKLAAGDRELARSIELGAVMFGSRSSWLALARSTRAEIAKQRGEWDRAAQLLADSIDVDDVSWDAMRGQLDAVEREQGLQTMLDAAWQLYAVGRDDRAIGFVRRVRDLPGLAGSLVEVAVDDLDATIAIERGELARARELLERERALLGPRARQEHLAGWHLTDAEMLERSGKLGDAEAEYRAALASLGPDVESTQAANLGLARCLPARGAAAEARALVEHTLQAPIETPRLAPALWRLAAELRTRAGDPAGARAAADQARATAAGLPAL